MKNFIFGNAPSGRSYSPALLSARWLVAVAIGLLSMSAKAQCTFNINGLIVDANNTVTTTTYPGGVHTINTSQKVHGTIRVMPGFTLVIENATLEFDDTRLFSGTLGANDPSRIVVERGGLLVLDNAVLTSLQLHSPCAAVDMWDGILVLGNPAELQGSLNYSPDPYQGKVITRNNTLIENARLGILLGTSGYTSTTKQVYVASTTINGGGIAYISETEFLNCYAGLYMTGYPHSRGNISVVSNSLFLNNAPLRDNLYTIQGAPTPGQFGIRITNAGGVTVVGTTFELQDGSGSGFSSVVTPLTVRGTGLSAVNDVFKVFSGCTFQNLYKGIYQTSTIPAFPAFIDGNTFEGNIYGAHLSGTFASRITNNAFNIGRGADHFSLGLSINNSTAYDVYDNTFTSGAACSPTICPEARGLVVSLSDGPDASNPISNTIYRNSFLNLGTGIYSQRGNAGLLLQCNSFRGPGVTTGSGTGSTITYADINAVGSSGQIDILRNRENPAGGITGQGTCNGSEPALAANNFFSHTSGALDIRIGSSIFPTLLYNYTSATVANTAPTSYSAAGTTNGGANPQSCATGTFAYSALCPTPGVRLPSVLRAILDTTTNPTTRSLTLNELLRYYLHDTTNVYGIDSAIAAVETYNTDGYGDIDAGLREQAGYPTYSYRTSGSGSGAMASAGTAQRGTNSGGSLYAEVRDLLAPYGDDPAAIGTALRTDSSLRQAMVDIANDTTTWGAVSAQAVLDRYLGYQFDQWYENGGQDEIILTRSGVLGLTGTGTAPVATLYPNPTTEAVTVAYQLPTGATSAQVLIVDGIGKTCVQRSLSGRSGEQTLSLASLPPGVYTYRILTDGSLVQVGKVVKLY